MPDIMLKSFDFGRALPNPTGLSHSERATKLDEARRRGTERVLRAVQRGLGLEPRDLAKLQSGARAWPAGHVGSVTHKATVVLAVLAKAKEFKGVGVDLERIDRADLTTVPGLASAEELPSCLPDSASRHALFCAKEAAFKAVHPTLLRPLGFADMCVSWTSVTPKLLIGEARVADVRVALRCGIRATWVAAIAAWQALDDFV